MQDKATAVSNTPSIDPVIWLEDALYKWGLWRSPGSTGASSLGYAMPAWAESAGLPAPSKVRLKLFTLDLRLVRGTLGRLSGRDESAVRAMLSAALTCPDPPKK